jgi:FAS-associated factor 2
MPNADRVVRRFATDALIEELYAFVECYDVLQSGETTGAAQEPEGFDHTYDFQLVSPMPREVYDVKAGGTIRERIGRSGNLIVERTSVESDDEEEE